ncbi:MAG: hypothetical protein CMH59_20060, partial [Myxococcales bacterium]|nr:hypothetical protein [Myxococcales bacterium]
AVAATPSGALLVYGGARDLPEGATAKPSLHVLRLPALEPAAAHPLDAAATAITCLDDRRAIVGTADGRLRVVDLESGAAAAVDAHEGAVRAIAFAGDGVYSVGDDGALRIFRRQDGGLEALGERRFGARPLRVAAIGPRGERLALGGDGGTVFVLSLGALDGEPREMAVGEGVRALAFTDDGRVAVGLADGGLRVGYLDGAPDFEDRAGPAAHERAVVGLVFGKALVDEANRPRPRRLYSIGADGAVKAWDLDSRRRPKSEALGGAPRAACWVASREHAAGQLAVVGRGRRVALATLQEDGAVGAIRALGGRLEELAATLRGGSEKARGAALDALSPLPEDEARALLDQVLLQDRSAALRERAAERIDRGRRRRSRGALRRALDDGQEAVRKAALNALTSIERDAPFAAARAALASKHADMRVTALARLPRLRAASPLVPTLVSERLADPEAAVRLAALDALEQLEGAESLEPARKAFARGEPDVRREALLRLARRGLAAGAGEELVEQAFDDPHENVRRTAVLVAIGARAPLAETLGGDPGFAGRLEEAEKGGAFQRAPVEGDAITAPLFAMLASRHVDTALAGAWALLGLGDPRCVGALLQLSRSERADVRRACVTFLQAAIGAGLEGAAPLRGRLELLLDDDDAQVRAAAFDALAALGQGRGAQAELALAERALRAVHPDLRQRALQLLVRFGGEGSEDRAPELRQRADALLGDALDDENGKVRDEAFRTLWAWHADDPRPALERGARSRHAALRRRVAGELDRQRQPAPEGAEGAESEAKPPHADWADALLRSLCADAATEVGLTAYAALRSVEANEAREEVHHAALASPATAVLVKALQVIDPASFAALRSRILDLVDDPRADVREAALACFDRLKPGDEVAFARAFDSVFLATRVRAIELCAARRDTRCITPARALLARPEHDPLRPPPALRQRTARALADVGHASLMPFFATLLDDADPLVREMGARGLATAARPGAEQPLVDALAHADLPVRSWVAEGLARLGDPRGLPVLVGTLAHDHRPIRLGAIMGFAALGPEGARGLLRGLDDADPEVRELVFGVLTARDLVLAEKGIAPDLLLSALGAASPEVRFGAARFLEARMAGDAVEVAAELVGPPVPPKAADRKDWPSEEERAARLRVLVRTLASDDPPRRYAATQVVALRRQPLAFWKEAAKLQGPQRVGTLRIPHTGWSDEARQPRKKGWMRSLVAGLEGTGDEGLAKLVFGVYAGLLRDAPPAEGEDATHRIRRDAIGRLQGLAEAHGDLRGAVLPVVRRALGDPHHLVRKAAVTALRALAGEEAALASMLEASAPDVGKQAVDELVAKAEAGETGARERVEAALDAPSPEVRKHALGRLPALYEQGSLDPFLRALESRHADVRFLVVDRLTGAQDPRVPEALGQAMESEHAALRLKAAQILARRGDARTLDVFAGLLRSEDHAAAAIEGLVGLSRKNREVADEVALALVARFEDDPDGTADRRQLLRALGACRSAAAKDLLVGLIEGEDEALRRPALEAAVEAARRADRQVDGRWEPTFDEPFLLEVLRVAAAQLDAGLRALAAQHLAPLDDGEADALLAALVDDRDEQVRVVACQALAARARRSGEGAAARAEAALVDVLRAGRRELTLVAAEALAERGAREAFRPLLLVLKAGEPPERPRAVLALGALGDPRGLEELEPLAFPEDELEPEDAALTPVALEALGAMLPRLEGEDAARVREAVERTAKLSSFALRQRAMSGLRRAGDDRSRALLEGFVSDPHELPMLRAHAARELGELAREGSEEALAAALQASDGQLRRAALDALRKLFPEDETRVALRALASPYGDVSGQAARYLARHADPATLVARLGQIDSDADRRRLREGLLRRGLVPAAALRPLLEEGAAGPREDAAWMAAEAGEASLGPAVVAAARRSADELERTPSDGAARAAAERAARAALFAATQLDADARAEARRLLERDALRHDALRHLVARGALDPAELEAWLGAADAADRQLAARALAERA